MDAQQITQRTCGVCPISHGLASVKSQEEAYGIEAPKNAQLIRNIMMAGDFIQNNITHFTISLPLILSMSLAYWPTAAMIA